MQLDLREAQPQAPVPPSIPPSPAANTPSSVRGLDRGTSEQTSRSPLAHTVTSARDQEHRRLDIDALGEEDTIELLSLLADDANVGAAIDEACDYGMPNSLLGVDYHDAPRGSIYAVPHVNQAVPLASQGGHYDEAQVDTPSHYVAHAYSLDDAAGANLAASWFGIGPREELARTVSNFELGFDVGLQLDWPEPPNAPLTGKLNGPTSHDTSLGRHNLSLMGDMPIAHGKGGSSDGASPSPDPRPLARVKRLVAPSVASISPESGGVRAPHRGIKRASSVARHDDDADMIGLLAKRRSPRKLKAAASTTDIDDAIETHPIRARASSPQPDNAAEARRRAAHDVADRLTQHESAYALCPDRPELLRGVVIDAAAAREAGIPRGTASADEWGFQWVRKFGLATNNRWMRPRAAPTAEDVLCEVWFAILALVWIAQMIAPSTRRKMAGYGQGMPTSALLALYGWRRVMISSGRYVADLAQVRSVLKGICARYKARWGDDAFVRTLKQPFTTEHLLAIVSLLEVGTLLVTWTSTLRMAVLTAFCHAISTGARKDEWTASFEGDTFVRRTNFNWVDAGGNDLPNTAATIASRKNGDLLRGRSAPSKCDRLNIEWGARDMWFRYDDRNPLNFAWRWRQWEEAHPCPISERALWPAFSPTGDSRPFTGSQADGLLRVLLNMVMSAAEAAQRTWHSCRITLATRLFARRGDAQGIKRDEVEGVIQSLVRWKTVEAMRIYARMQPTQYADYVDMATDPRVTTEGAIPSELPEVDPEGILAETQATINAIDSEEAIKAKATKAARDKDAPKATTKRGQRRDTPPTGGVSSTAAEPEAQQRVFDIGDGLAVPHLGDDSWNIMGQRLRVHNSFWGWEGNDYSECIVAGYVGEHSFASSKLSKHTYIIDYDGHYYPATHTMVAGALMDATVKRRIRKMSAPRLI